MRAYELDAKDGFDALTPVERKAPPLGATDVRVRVRAVSLNYRDLIVASTAKSRGDAKHVVPASDGAGEIVEVGREVTRFRGGERVAALFFPRWQDGALTAERQAVALGGGVDGMLAEEVVLPDTAWAIVPEHLSFEEASTLPCAGVTAYNALFEAARVGPGDIVLVQGTGGVSLFALQLAKAAGARVIVTSKDEAKRTRARSLGADHALDYVGTPAWGEAAMAWTGGRGVDLVVEVGGPGTFDQSVSALRYGGSISLIGILTGVRGEVNIYDVFRKGLNVHGVYVGSARMFASLTRALTATRLTPVVDRVFPFEDARAAYEYLAAGRHFGKVVIRVA